MGKAYIKNHPDGHPDTLMIMAQWSWPIVVTGHTRFSPAESNGDAKMWRVWYGWQYRIPGGLYGPVGRRSSESAHRLHPLCVQRASDYARKFIDLRCW